MPKSSEEALATGAAVLLLYGLLQEGILEDLVEYHSAEDLAASNKLDVNATRAMLDFLTRTSGLVSEDCGRFKLNLEDTGYPRLRFLLEKFLGAYGPLIRNPIASLSNINSAFTRVDSAALTRAFSDPAESSVVLDVIRGMNPVGLLDLGCGQGQTLSTICRELNIRGWGIDRSTAMCKSARAKLGRAGLSRQVKIRCADAMAVNRVFSATELGRVDTIYVASLLNEWMADRKTAIGKIAWLAKVFPGRRLVVVDYLGALGTTRRAGPYTYLTDLSQSISGQGVPPTSHREWHHIYQSAGVRLDSVLEARDRDLRWFVHNVAIPI